MKVHVSNDRVFVEGKGGRFLKAKARLAKALSAANLRHEGSGKVSIPLDRLYAAAEVLLDSDAEISPEAHAALQAESDRVSRHVLAKDSVRGILEEQRAATGDEYWDEVLDPKQGLAVNAMLCEGLAGLCLFDEQGIGKTVMVIAAFDLLRRDDRVNTMIVVCPKIMAGTWPKEIAKFARGGYSVKLVEGTREQKYRQLQETADIYVMNFESVATFLTSLTGLARRAPALLVVDESHYVKNPEAIRSNAVKELRKDCAKAFMLCGTPAPNSPEDVIHQFDIADNGLTFEGFRVPEDSVAAKAAIARNIEERGVFLRRLKEDALPDLPAKSFEVLTVAMIGKQKALYEQCREELVLLLQGLDNTTFRRSLATYFQKRAALLQICVSPRLIDPLYDEEPAKYARLDALLERLVEREGKKVVIWSFYRASLDDLERRYERYGLVRVDGSVAGTTARNRAVELFQSSPDTRLFLGNPAAAGAGLTLHAAADAVYLSYSNQAAHYLQSLDRIHRRGQEADYTNYYLFACEGTVEEAEIRRLRRKEKQQQELLGDRVAWPSSLDDALEELGGGQ